MKRIISLAGTQGTGKTTISYEVCTELKKSGFSSVVLDERARECPFPINTDASNETQVWLIVSHIKKELELLKAYDFVVSDRSVVDPYVYGIVLNLGGIFENLVDYCVGHINKYYGKLYLMDPTKFDYCVADGVRSTDQTFRNDVHSAFLDTLNRYGIDFALVSDKSDIIREVLDYAKEQTNNSIIR